MVPDSVVFGGVPTGIGCFTDSDGVQRQRSTGSTERSTAMAIAMKYEAAYAMKLTEAQARKVVSDIYEQLHGEQLYHATARKFLTDWMAGKKNSTACATIPRPG